MRAARAAAINGRRGSGILCSRVTRGGADSVTSSTACPAASHAEANGPSAARRDMARWSTTAARHAPGPAERRTSHRDILILGRPMRRRDSPYSAHDPHAPHAPSASRVNRDPGPCTSTSPTRATCRTGHLVSRSPCARRKEVGSLTRQTARCGSPSSPITGWAWSTTSHRRWGTQHSESDAGHRQRRWR